MRRSIIGLLAGITLLGAAGERAALGNGFGDYDCNCVRDLADSAAFFDCLAGPNVDPAPTPPMTAAECVALFSFDDTDVDFFDYRLHTMLFNSTLPNQDPTAILTANTNGADAGVSIAFDGTESFDPDCHLASYHFDFDDGEFSTNGYDTHAYEYGGDYDVVLTVTDSCGGVDTDTVAVTIEGPPASFTGTWALSPGVFLNCAYGLVALDFSSVYIADSNPSASVEPVPWADEPGTMTGLFTTPQSIEAQNMLAGICNETYTFEVTFTSATQFSGTFTAEFSGTCFDCATQVWNITGTKTE